MDAPCPACSRGPTGFAGHDQLNVQKIGDRRMTLQCGPCGAFWSRTLEKEGYFSWVGLTAMEAGAERGVAVPSPRLESAGRGSPWRGSSISGRAPRRA